MFRNAAEGMVLSNREGIIEEVNPRINVMFGYERDELIGKGIDVLVPRDKRGQHKHHREGFNENPSNRPMGMRKALKALRKDGSQFPVEISLNFIGDHKDMKIMALITDISVRHEAELQIRDLNEKLEQRVEERTASLKQTQSLYTTISRNFPDGTISLVDRNLTYLFLEGKSLYEAGIDSAKILGSSIEKRLPSDVKDVVIDHLNKVLNGEDGSIEFETKGNFFELNAVLVKGKIPELDQILIVERNISKQKKAEADMLHALQKERSLNELKSRFVSMASHEFRTPLSTMLSSISLIERYNEGENSEKIDKHVNRIKSSVRNLNEILQDFLSLDKLEEGKLTQRSSEVKLDEMIDDIIDEFEAVLKKGQHINYNIKSASSTVRVDATILKNILINLLSNANKYAPEDSEIKLNVVQVNGHLDISVEDKGIGIPKSEQNQLFDRFFRAKNALNIEGTGLGLNIVKRYLDLLGGNIDLESEEGRGTTVKIQVPVSSVS